MCPRKAWLEQAFGVSGEDLGAEDVDRREQGDLVHRFEEASLRAFGTWSEEGWRTSESSAFSPDDINAHWVEVIDAVFEQTPWLDEPMLLRCIDGGQRWAMHRQEPPRPAPPPRLKANWGVCCRPMHAFRGGSTRDGMGHRQRSGRGANGALQRRR